MTIPLVSLLSFASWTLIVLMATIGVHRWSQILTGKAPIHSFPADAREGPDWYQRATRAHANCIENLPVFGAIVAVATFSGLESRWLDILAVAVIAARICQTSVHVGFPITARTVGIRFTFYSVQLVAMLVMIAMVVVATRSH